MKQKIILLAIFLAVAYVLYATLFGYKSVDLQGREAPLFAVEAPDQSLFRLSDHIGQKVILVNLWATWCPTCRDEIPVLNNMQRTLDPNRFMIVSVMLDEAPNLEKKIAALNKYKSKIPVEFPVYFDDNFKVADTYGTYKLPESYLIDLKGRIHYKHVGPILPQDQGALTQMIRNLF